MVTQITAAMGSLRVSAVSVPRREERHDARISPFGGAGALLGATRCYSPSQPQASTEPGHDRMPAMRGRLSSRGLSPASSVPHYPAWMSATATLGACRTRSRAQVGMTAEHDGGEINDGALRSFGVEARRLIGERKLSPVELLESCIARIERTNTAVNAIVAMDVDAARKRAKEIEQAIGRGEDVGLLAGLPIGVKDLQATAGLRTTLGLAAVQGQRAGRGRVQRRQHPPGRRRHPRQDQHAGVRRRRQHDQPRLRPDRQSLRSRQDLRRLLRRLGRRAGAGAGGARHRLRPRRQPAHAGVLLRRGRLPALARRGAQRRSRRRASRPSA